MSLLRGGGEHATARTKAKEEELAFGRAVAPSARRFLAELKLRPSGLSLLAVENSVLGLKGLLGGRSRYCRRNRQQQRQKCGDLSTPPCDETARLRSR